METRPSRQKIQDLQRRKFIKFLSGASVSLSLGTQTGCQKKEEKKEPHPYIKALSPSNKDQLLLSEGLKYQILISWEDVINKSGDQFGFNNDFTAVIPFKKKNDQALLWVNHEYVDPLLIHRDDRFLQKSSRRSKEHILKEMKAVGGSLLHISRDKEGLWQVKKSSEYNRRIDGTTPIPLIAPRKISGSNQAIGTHGNCAGGVTPWGSVLTCEEGYSLFFSEKNRQGQRISRAFFCLGSTLQLPP